MLNPSSPAEFLGQALPDKYARIVWHVLASEIHRAAAASDCALCQITASDDFVRQRKGLERAFECFSTDYEGFRPPRSRAPVRPKRDHCQATTVPARSRRFIDVSQGLGNAVSDGGLRWRIGF